MTSATPILHKTNIGVDDNGRARHLHHFAEGVSQFHHTDNPDPEAYVAMYVGPNISHTITLGDGTSYSLADDVIAVPAKHVGELDELIGKHYEDNGHPLAGEGGVFRRTPSQLIRFGGDADDGRGGASMANASAAAENAALNGLDGTGVTNVIPDVSLHVGAPSTTGANENANTGSYARQACTWNAASAGAKTNSTALTFTTGGTIAVTAFGTWSSATYAGGTYALGGNLTSPVTAVTITIATGAISIAIT